MTDGQRNAFAKHWPLYGLSLFDTTIANPFDAMEQQGDGKSILEVGFGMGDSLFEMAQQQTADRFIGIEVHPPGVGRLMHLAAQSELTNLKVYMADATDVLADRIPSNSVDRFQLFFPDPWHKKKHNKRRILNADFLDEIIRVLKPGGIFHMATDWEPYAEAAMVLLSLEKRLENCSEEFCFTTKPDYRPGTKFERRGQKLGHGVWDICFAKADSK